MPRQAAVPVATAQLEVRLLGGFQVLVNGAAVPDRAWRQRRAAGVVKLLALAPGYLLHREQVLELLWPELELEDAANNLRVALHHARRQLTDIGGDGAREFLTRDGELLRLGPADRITVDVTVLETAIAAIWRTGQFAAADDALIPYTGELLPMDPYEDWVADRRTMLQTSVATLLSRQAGWLSDAGQVTAAIAARQRQLAIEPLDEAAHVALLRELAAAGQAHQALTHYERLVELFERELGAPPEPATQALAAAIRRGELSPGPSPVAPSAASATVPVDPITAAVTATPATLAIANPLPAPVDALIGRDQALAELTHLLPQVRLLTLTGPGGVGKTRLALAVAATATATHLAGGGVAFVDLAPLADAALVLPTIATVLGVVEQGETPLVRQIAAAIGETPLLLVVDNLEHVLAAASDLATLLGACPRLRLLATSRSRLQLRGEQEYPVPPLALPPAGDDATPDPSGLRLREIAASPAVALFVRRAVQARPDFILTPDDAPAVAAICARLDGLPLALEMAAARVRLLPPTALRQRLERPLAVLAAGTRDVASRQQTLRATIAWSYDLLGAKEQALFDALGVFAGGAELNAVEAVAQTVGLDPLFVLDQAAALVDHSLVQQTADSRGEARLRQLETIRDFARERLAARDQTAPHQAAHLAWYLTLAETAAPALTGAAQADWLTRLELDHDNLRAALAFAETGDPAGFRRLVAALWRFWWVRGHLTEGRRWLGAALAGASAPTGPPDRALATAYDGAGALAEAQGDFAEAAAHHTAALAIWDALGDAPGQVRALMNLGLVADVRGEPREAVRQYEAALDLARAAGDAAGIAGCLANLGFAQLDLGEPARAETAFREALTRFQTLGDHRHAVSVLDGLGIVAFLRGDFAGAAAIQAEALAQFEALGDRQGAADALGNLAHATQRLGDGTLAEERFADALARYRALGDQSGIAFALTHLGRLAQARGDLKQAGILLREALALSWRLEDRTAVIEAMEGLATHALATGEATQTAQLLGAATTLRVQTGVPLPAVYVPELQQTLLAARTTLGEKAFTAALAAGATAIQNQTLLSLPPVE